MRGPVRAKAEGVRVLVLGAGIVGTASAWFLRKAGHEVQVVERQSGVAREASLANGGQISVSHAEPWANPQAPLQILRWLGRADAPLLFRLQPDVRQWLWGLAFLRECLPARTAANIRSIVQLALFSRDTVKAMRRELELDYHCVERGILHFYTDRAEFEATRTAAALMTELGCERRSMSAAEAIAVEPALAPLAARIVGADFCAEDESGDAHEFTRQLALRAGAQGVEFSFDTSVLRILASGGRVEGVEVAGPDGWPRQLVSDAVVVCMGVHTPQLLSPLGMRLPIYPGKGYSATYDIVSPSHAPSVSLTDDQHKIVFSRFGSRLRVAGTAEIGGWSAALNPERCSALTRRTSELFPGACDYGRPRFWAGLRPMTPSNVPYLGATRLAGLFLNAGHGTLGWTLGAGSGRLIADVVSGRTPALPLSPLRV